MIIKILSIKKRPLWKRILFINNHDIIYQIDDDTKKTALFISDSTTLTPFLLLHYTKNRYLKQGQFSKRNWSSDWIQFYPQITEHFNSKSVLNKPFTFKKEGIS